MLGTWLYQHWLSIPEWKRGPIERLLLFVLMISFCCLSVPPLVDNSAIRFVVFCIFECCVGVFWPAISSLRSVYIPEEVRSTMMNIFRVPLNLLVVLILAPTFSLPTVFLICSFLMFLTIIMQTYLYQEVQQNTIALGPRTNIEIHNI